jgi:hypothetical protein
VVVWVGDNDIVEEMVAVREGVGVNERVDDRVTDGVSDGEGV